jgi:hypothetical protein
MPRRRKGLSALAVSAFYISVAAVAVVTVYNLTQPLATDISDTQTLEQMVEKLPAVEKSFQQVASAGEGSRTTIGIRFREGTLQFDQVDDTIEYILQTQASLVTPRSSRQFGNVRVSSGADVLVNETTIDGVPCWLLQNDHVEACIRKKPEANSRLLGYWDLDRGSGQELEDQSNRSNTGMRGTTAAAQSGDPAWIDECVYDNCLSFDGSDDQANLGQASGDTQAISVGAWVYVEDAGTTNPVLSTEKSGNQGLTLRVRNGNADFVVGDGSIWHISSGGLIEDRRWYHVMGQYNGTHLSVFVDGDLEDRRTLASRSTSDANVTAGYNSHDGTYLNGRIDEMTVYNYSLGQEEVESRISTGTFGSNFIDTTDLLVHYKNLDSGSALEQPEVRAIINSNESSDHGFGYTEPDTIDDELGEGEVRASIRSLIGIDYVIRFRLLSGSDFLLVDVEED